MQWYLMIFCLFVSLVHSQSILEIECNSTAEETCTFDGLELTRSNYRFKPGARFPQDIRTLEFKNSILPGFSKEFCETFFELQQIFVNDAKLELIDDGALDSCSRLTIFSIGSNRVRRLPPTLFRYNRQIQEIYLNRNVLVQLDRSQFVGLEKLRLLSLSNNELDQFPVESIFGTVIEELVLYTNNIHYLDVEAIVDELPTLKKISYNNNELSCARVRNMNRLLTEGGITVEVTTDSRARFYTTDAVGTIQCLIERSWAAMIYRKENEKRFV